MKIAVCDDEAVFAEKLISLLEAFCECKEESFSSDVYSCFGEAEEGLSSGGYELIFLDINLGGSLDGVELCRRLREKGDNTPVVFVTSLENRAVDGYDVNAFGFVVKKQLAERLQAVMERYWKEYRCVNTVTINEKSGVTVLPVKEILWAEAENRSSLIHAISGEYKDIRQFGVFSRELEGSFIEVFRSIYVNVDHIRSINADTVTLTDGTTVPLSRRSRKNVVSAVMDNVSKGRLK